MLLYRKNGILNNKYEFYTIVQYFKFDELLDRLDSNSEIAISYIISEEIQNALKKKRKYRKAITRKFGRGYENKFSKLNKVSKF